MRKKIYVETKIDAAIEDIWKYTQTPELHQQWDLRFSEITYIPKVNEQDRQRFLYKTNIGFGISIAGEGESFGTKEINGIRTSTLQFGTDQRLSLIKQGSGFWRYIPTENGVTFLTLYDYNTRFGWPGAVFDRYIFRPLIGWATAWSFDALRLWLEQGIHPRSSLLRSIRHMLIALTLCFLWGYQGLVPKLLFPNSGELEHIRQLSMFVGYEDVVLTAIGILEILFGVALLMFSYRSKWLHIVNIAVLLLLLFSGLAMPSVYVAPFNPVTLNVAMMLLSLLSLLEREPLARAGQCLRKPREGEERS